MGLFRKAVKPKSLHRHVPAKLRFELQVEKKPGCWEWRGGTTDYGYGRLRVDGKQIGAHRFSYLYYNGEIPNGLWVLHTCDNPPCTNPRHLYLGTAEDNANDREERTEGTKGENNPRAKLTESEVREIVRLWQTGEYSKLGLSRMFPVNDSMIGRIVKAEAWVEITEELVNND